MRDFKVCILAAGVGARMAPLSDHVNKAILPVSFKATISHVIEKFSPDVEFVVAVGHLKETVIDYLALAHPERAFDFVRVDRWVGPGAGPGYSLLKCRDSLECPFVFVAADTIVLEEIPVPDRNWFGVAPVEAPAQYCTAKIRDNLVRAIEDKVETSNKNAFIGLAGVYDYQDFFEQLQTDKTLVGGELQVSNGFKRLVEKKLHAVSFTWFDTGSLSSYADANKRLSGDSGKFDFSKGNEFIYFVNGRVIKYFANAETARKRCERATQLRGLCPEIIASRDHFYAYSKVPGRTLYAAIDNQVFSNFLAWAEDCLWKTQSYSAREMGDFATNCRRFYYDKTRSRLQLFYKKTGVSDGAHRVNGVPVPALENLFSRIDWESLFAGIPARIHGDLQFDNVLVPDARDGGGKPFLLLDWREDFGGSVETGDLYYDLAKLYGGMMLSYELIKKGLFSFEMNGNDVRYDFYSKNNLSEARETFEEFINTRGFDLRKVKTLVGLIFLNMAPLHNEPFDRLLYFLGKSALFKNLSDVPASVGAAEERQESAPGERGLAPKVVES